MAFKVYIAEYLGARNHVRIFVETEEDGSGQIYHVTGTILRGMEFETRRGPPADSEPEYVPGTKQYIGRVKDLAMFEEICRQVPPPEAQVKLDGTRIDPTKPLRRCGEWVLEAKAKLIEEEIVVKED